MTSRNLGHFLPPSRYVYVFLLLRPCHCCHKIHDRGVIYEQPPKHDTFLALYDPPLPCDNFLSPITDFQS
jgi:hypothetical protein